MAQGVSYKVLNMTGKEVGSIDLDPKIFDVTIDESLVHETVRWQRAKRRAGTHSALKKGEMKGGGKKPFKQKGTGGARAGSNTSPLWVGGGVMHGPKPRDYDFRLPKRTRKQALCSVLTDKVKSNTLFILDSLSFKKAKTKEVISFLSHLGLKSKSSEAKKDKLAIITPLKDDNICRASGNLKNVLPLSVPGVNVYDLLNHRYLLCTKDGVKALEARIQGKGE